LLRYGCLISAAIAVLPGRAQTVIASVATGPNPFAIAVNTATNIIYVSHGNGVTVIDGATNATATVAVGSGPGPLAVDMVTDKVYVACGNSVTVIDGATNATTSVATGTNPVSIAVNPTTNKAYVADANNGINGSVREIDGATDAVATIADGFDVGPIAVNPGTNMIYVCGNILGGEATVIDGATYAALPLGSVPMTPIGGFPDSPDAIVVDTATNRIYIGNQDPSDVTLIDGATNALSTAGVSEGVSAIAVNIVTNTVYAIIQGSTGIMVIDGATNAASFIATAANSAGIAVNPATNRIYVANLAAMGTVTVIDGSTKATTTVSVGANPFAVAVNPVTDRIYVLGEDASGTVTVIDGTPVSVAPSFAGGPMSQTVEAGTSVVFNAPAGGMPSPTYRWSFDGSPLSDGGGISGSTGPILYLRGASSAVAGAYTCTATNSAGSATSAAAILSVVGTPAPGRLINLSSRAYAGTLIAGFVLTGEAPSPLILRGVGPSLAGFGVLDFAATPDLWLYDSASPANLITGDSGWQAPPSAPEGFWAGKAAPVDATAADFEQVGAFALSPGSADSAVKIALPAGAYTSQVVGTGDSGVALAEVYLADAGNPGTQLANISSRAYITGGASILIAGFVISGSTSETVLIRASGPALAPFGVFAPLPDPKLLLFDASQDLLASDAGWAGSPQIAGAAATVGAFGWNDPSSADSAFLVTLPPGSYTAQLTSLTGNQGTALLEVYAVPRRRAALAGRWLSFQRA
jgi:YVTN family beta-propeller protein